MNHSLSPTGTHPRPLAEGLPPMVSRSSLLVPGNGSDERQVPRHDDRLPDARRLRIAARRKSQRGKAKIERERSERWERTCREVEEVYAEYLAAFPHDRAKATGVVYARFSSRCKESIADQVRSILEYALRHTIFVPAEMIFIDLAVQGVRGNREGLYQARNCLRQKRASVLLLFSMSRLFRKPSQTLEFVHRVHKDLNVRCVFVGSGVDTDDKHRWEMIVTMHAMINQFVLTTRVARVRFARKNRGGLQMPDRS
jgi:predicted site-specific integrase-resolvase